MPVFYLDTSALVKRYRSEAGTEVVEELLKNPRPEDRFFLSFLSILELTSGVLRLAKAGQLRDATATQILAQFRSDVRELYKVWPLSEEVAVSAVAVVEQHKLRSADALHLAATASTVGDWRPGPARRFLRHCPRRPRVGFMTKCDTVAPWTAKIRRMGPGPLGRA